MPGKDHEVEGGDVGTDNRGFSSVTSGADDNKTTRVNDEIVTSVRKGIKIVSLLLEAGPSQSSDRGGSEGEGLAHRDISSKTD